MVNRWEDLEKFPYEVHQCVKANTQDASERRDPTSVRVSALINAHRGSRLPEPGN